MKNKNRFIADYMDKHNKIIESEEFKTRFQKHIDFIEMVSDGGYVWNTPTSYSLKVLREYGYKPIGITTMMCEETFIFETQEEASRAYEDLEVDKGEIDGFFYGRTAFIHAMEEYQKDYETELTIYWF